MELDFEFTWADYITECPYKNNVMVGEYECTQCEHFGGCTSTLTEEYKNAKPCEYKRYSITAGKGKVKCNYKLDER